MNLSCRSGRVRDGLQHCVDVVDSIHVDRQAGHPLMGYRAHLKPTQSIEPLQDESEDGAVVLTAQDVVLFRCVLRPNVLLVQVTQQ